MARKRPRRSSPAFSSAQEAYYSSGSGGAERLRSGSSGPASASRTSVASISVTVSTTGVLGGFPALTFFRAFFAPPLRLALAGRFAWCCPRYGPFHRSFPRRLGGLASFAARYRLCFSFSYCWSLLPLSHYCPLWRVSESMPRSILAEPPRKQAHTSILCARSADQYASTRCGR